MPVEPESEIRLVEEKSGVTLNLFILHNLCKDKQTLGVISPSSQWELPSLFVIEAAA
jgi:hypothetical protein